MFPFDDVIEVQVMLQLPELMLNYHQRCSLDSHESSCKVLVNWIRKLYSETTFLKVLPLLLGEMNNCKKLYDKDKKQSLSD